MVWKLRATGEGTGGMIADRDELARGLRLFADPDRGCELVAIPSGRFSNLPGRDVEGLVVAVESFPNGYGVYFRLNPVPIGLGRCAKKADMLRRRWLYIDVDPIKAHEHAANPASDEEKAGTKQVAESVHGYLSGLGWPAPVIMDSGNGTALLWRIDLECTAASQSLLRRLLNNLDRRFKDQPGKIDCAVHDATRLCKLPGTWARKGQCSDDRPYRPCRILYAPELPTIVTAIQIEQASGEEAKVGGGLTLTATNNDNKAYVRGAVEREAASVLLAVPGPDEGRNNALNKAAFSLGRYIGGGVLERTEVESVLTKAALACGLDPEEIPGTLRSGIESGMLNPRTGPEKPNPAAQPKVAASSAVPTGSPIIEWAASITPRPVEWLWPGRIPLGKLTTFAGVGGLGKTFVLCDITARITTGAPWPDSPECAEPGKVLFISGEDDPDDTLVPRLIECGANLDRVAFLKTEVMDRFTMADLDTLEKALEQMGDTVRFVAIDPPTAYLGGVNDHKNAELRQLLTPLKSWASRHRVAIVFNTHVNKPQGAKVDAMMRVMGSVAWVNAVRAAHMFARDPADPERRLFCGMKNNLGKEIKGLAYCLEAVGPLAKVKWLGEVDTTADEAINKEGGKRKRSVVASEWLEELFNGTDRLSSTLIYKTKDETTTLSKDALKEAKEDMGIRARQECDDEGNRQWFWYWPKEAREAWERRKTDASVVPNPAGGDPDTF